MKLLIVDDEYYSVENLKTKLDWAAMGFGEVLIAYSMEQAQQVFANHTIDVLLCDIEMPKGTGLELLAWMRAEGLDTACVFLTCYAKFDYASKALKLGGSDYLLKPVEAEDLERAVAKAVEKRRQDEAARLSALHAEYWQSSGVQRAERFWKRVADGNIPPEEAALARELRELHLPAQLLEERFVPVLLDCVKTDTVLEWEQNLYEYALKNVLNEVLFAGSEPSTIVRLYERQYFIPFRLKAGAGQAGAGQAEGPRPVAATCQDALDACQSTLPGVFRFYLEAECGITGIHSGCVALLRAARDDIARQSAVHDLTAAPAAPPRPELPPAPLERWADLLAGRGADEVRRQAVQYLGELGCSKNASRQDLTVFYHDFSQLIYAALDRRGAPAHRLFSDTEAAQVAEHACDNVPAMEQWLTYILTAYMESLAAAGESGSVIEEVQAYVRDHLAEDLNRNCLAAAVYLSPDYLSHLFREKAGTSLTAYITKERIRKARELLGQSQLSIRDIALASGFQNISYFSKQFKREVGQTPQEFRKG